MTLAACAGAEGVADAGCSGAPRSPANLMVNGGFECGGDSPTEWMAVNGVMTFITSGASEGTRAAKIVSDATGTGGVGSSAPVVKATSGKNYCINARVKGTASDVRLEVFGMSLTSAASPLASPDKWVRVPPTTNLLIREPIDQQLYVKVRANASQAGDTLIVDDIDLWESTDGKCNER